MTDRQPELYVQRFPACTCTRSTTTAHDFGCPFAIAVIEAHRRAKETK